mmetsp:Transcript_10784/g.33286  ORF Transcript_10784/g.33286 Transcript_10784/m.33286 type:complete len:217 (-) Transcript_10784:19-669(-)
MSSGGACGRASAATANFAARPAPVIRGRQCRRAAARRRTTGASRGGTCRPRRRRPRGTPPCPRPSWARGWTQRDRSGVVGATWTAAAACPARARASSVRSTWRLAVGPASAAGSRWMSGVGRRRWWSWTGAQATARRGLQSCEPGAKSLLHKLWTAATSRNHSAADGWSPRRGRDTRTVRPRRPGVDVLATLRGRRARGVSRRRIAYGTTPDRHTS